MQAREYQERLATAAEVAKDASRNGAGKAEPAVVA
jgi:hypothetical protein